MMAHRGLSASESWMRADIHDGPELRLYIEAEYIDAALTFVSLPTSSCDARPDHTNGMPENELERPLKTGRQDRPEAADAGHGIPERTLARQLSIVLLLLHSGSTDLTNARGSR